MRLSRAGTSFREHVLPGEVARPSRPRNPVDEPDRSPCGGSPACVVQASHGPCSDHRYRSGVRATGPGSIPVGTTNPSAGHQANESQTQDLGSGCPGSLERSQSALGGIRTPNLLIRSQMLYPLSYERVAGREQASESLACAATGDEIVLVTHRERPPGSGDRGHTDRTRCRTEVAAYSALMSPHGAEPLGP